MAENTVQTFLRSLRASVTENVEWPGGFSLEVTTYLSNALPPPALHTSARAIVFLEQQVLVMSDQTPTTHIVPGGRMERGELPGATVIREVAEESGWEVVTGAQIGVLHFRHLNPKPEAFTLPFPDFFQTVYIAGAVRFRPELREVDGWETNAEFVSIPEAESLTLSAGERILLTAAIEAASRVSPGTTIT